MNHNEIEFYVHKANAERAKALRAGFRTIRQAVARAVASLGHGFTYLRQPKVFQ